MAVFGKIYSGHYSNNFPGHIVTAINVIVSDTTIIFFYAWRNYYIFNLQMKFIS
jgi:hypothetical protein